MLVVGQSRQRTVALPLMKGPKGLESLVNWFSFTWQPLGRDDEWADEVLAEIAADLRGQAHRIDLSPVPSDGGVAERLEAAFRAAGWFVFREQCDENHVLHVDGRSFAEYWAYRPGRMRTTHKRKAGKVEVNILSSFQEDTWQVYQDIYSASWKPEEERADLLEAFARAEGERGHLRLGLAYAEGKPVAAQFWTVENGTAYIHKLAHVEGAETISAGTTLTAAMFEHVIDTDRVSLVDFGTGSDAYKRDWMENTRPRYLLTCIDWRRPTAWPALGKRLLRRLARR